MALGLGIHSGIVCPVMDARRAQVYNALFRMENGTLTVRVGQVTHPMETVHYIQWIYVKTGTGSVYRYLEPGQAPEAIFSLGDGRPLAVYAYCNLHGLWMTEV